MKKHIFASLPTITKISATRKKTTKKTALKELSEFALNSIRLMIATDVITLKVTKMNINVLVVATKDVVSADCLCDGNQQKR